MITRVALVMHQRFFVLASMLSGFNLHIIADSQVEKISSDFGFSGCILFLPKIYLFCRNSAQGLSARRLLCRRNP